MGQWVSSREFAEKYNINYHALKMACIRANKRSKKFCAISSYILHFKYADGIGRGGKVLQIWSEPLTSEQVKALEKGYPMKYVLEEMGEVVESVRVDKSMESFKQSPRNDRVVKRNVCESMDCHELRCNSRNDEGATHNDKVVGRNGGVESRNDAAVTQPNVMESMDSKTLDCSNKGNNDEKIFKENSRKALHNRGCDNANERNNRTTSGSDSALYRNDLSNGGVATWHNLTPNQKAQAKQREKILIDYESAKLSGIKVAHFLQLKNSADSTLKLTQGKLFDWQRKYKTQGLSALSDKRGVSKIGTTSLPQWTQEEDLKMWRIMGSGYLNRMQIWRELHIMAHLYVKGYSFEKFLKCEIPPLFSLNTLNRFLDSYLKANSLEYTLIAYGSDKTDSYKEPAYGIQRDLYTLPNQLWQIDSSPLDAIVLDSDSKQIRPSILSIVDVYSGRSIAYLSETSDSNAVVRLMWKAFESMGKPQAIQFDNGKDYISNKVQGLLDGLNIKFVRSAAYKGKAKAVVERRFRTIQGSYITALNSYIGRNTAERFARESQTPKRERRAKDSLGNPLKTQQQVSISFKEAQVLLDEAVEYWNIDRVSRRWSKAQGKSPMDLWSEANFQKESVDYAQFLLYAEAPKVRTAAKNMIPMHPYAFVPTKYIEAGSKVLVSLNINASNEAFIFNLKGEFLCKAYDKKAQPLTQEQIKTISKEYKTAIKRIRDLQKDATHSEFIRRNARYEAESLKRKKDNAILQGVGENTEKTYKTKVKESIKKSLSQENLQDDWDFEVPENYENKKSVEDTWDKDLAKLGS